MTVPYPGNRRPHTESGRRWTQISSWTTCFWVSALHLYWSVYTVYPKKYAHGFVVLCFVVVMQSFIMNSHEVFINIHQGCFAGTGAIVRLPQCQWSKPDGYGKTSQYITTTKHSKAKTLCIFLGIYCTESCHDAYPVTTGSTACFRCATSRGVTSCDKARSTPAVVFQYTLHDKIRTKVILFMET